MSSDIALRVENLGKKYTIRHKDHDHATLSQSALHRLRHPRGAAGREEFWALNDVSFEVPRGEVLGVIGHNGAGKSTLLKILSRITAPTTGRVDVFGRIGSLLEVGTGFHPELTGRENVYLNGSILGMKKKEIERQFDAIVDFSGVEQFLDTPVKRYSSGMYVRLAFAVAAHLDTEILLLDEVLAVGDAEFQKKCLGKMGEVAAGGRTVVLVSHNLTAIRTLAAHTAVLDQGRVVWCGEPQRGLELYQQTDGDRLKPRNVVGDWQRSDPTLPQHVRFQSVRLLGDISEGVTSWNSEMSLIFGLIGRTQVEDISLSVTIRELDGSPVGVCEGPGFPAPDPGVAQNFEVALPRLRLLPGRYVIDVAVGVGSIRGNRLGIDKVTSAAGFEVQAIDGEGRPVANWWTGFGVLDLGVITHHDRGAVAGAGGSV